MPVTWTDNDKYRLLLAIIDTMQEDQTVKMPDWKTVAGKMGETFTAEAVRQKFQNIKKNAKSELIEGGTPGKGNPRGRKGTAKKDASDGETETPKLKKRGAKIKLDAVVDDPMSEDEEVASPPKKQKRGKGETEKTGFVSNFPNLKTKVKGQEDTSEGQVDEEGDDEVA